MPRLSETRWFLQSSSFWKARFTQIVQLSSALWLTEYLKREPEMFTMKHSISTTWRRWLQQYSENNS